MLETDEVDIDYFTPAGSTSLASIFGKSSVADETTESPTLMYVPPPPPEKPKPDEVNPTQWIFTCAANGFDWVNSQYINRGKLGFAILKFGKANSHCIILYDSNKTTVSCVTVFPKLNIYIRDLLTISYYDNARKYWCIKTSYDDMNKILQILNGMQVTLVPSSIPETGKEQTGNSKIHKKNDVAIKDDEHKEKLETQIDYYTNQAYKNSIKQQAVLPKSIPTTPCGTDINVFISEQKVSNSELRINVNRVSDKIDVLLERLNDIVNIGKSNSYSNFQSDIVQKLIREYESKIKYYENIMDTIGIHFHTTNTPEKSHLNENLSNSCKNNMENMKKIDELENECREKDIIIEKLENEIKEMNADIIKTSANTQEKIDGLVMEIGTLNENLNLKNEEIDTVKKYSNNLNDSKQESSDIGNKVKKIINDTFEAISVNFDDKEVYSGERIKAIMAIVIKKKTIQTLKEL